MSNARQAASEDIHVGEAGQLGQSIWLSPVLLGVGAPIVLGLVVAPQLLEGAGAIVGLLLALLLVLALTAYIVSVAFPGTPRGLVVQSASRELVVIRRGVFARSEVKIPFSDVARIGASRGFDHDGYEVSALEVRTRGGDSWIVPGDLDEADIAAMRRMIGLSTRTR